MTHAGVDPGERTKLGITPNLVRLSVGVEHPSDLIHDLGAALSAIAS
jgi:methionine-gamma-lyase